MKVYVSSTNQRLGCLAALAVHVTLTVCSRSLDPGVQLGFATAAAVFGGMIASFVRKPAAVSILLARQRVPRRAHVRWRLHSSATVPPRPSREIALGVSRS